MQEPVKIYYFSDILCIWAYAAQIRIEELIKNHGAQIDIDHRFVSVFGSTRFRIGAGWKDRGMFEGYADHVHDISDGFTHIDVNPDVWRSCVPETSMTGHLFIKAVQLLERDGLLPDAPDPNSAHTLADRLAWQVRCAFFAGAKDIGNLHVLLDVAAEMGLPVSEVSKRINDGSAMSALSDDFELAATYQVRGSPSFLMNDGRQRLYGNVGYRVLEANVAELLDHPKDQASWC